MMLSLVRMLCLVLGVCACSGSAKTIMEVLSSRFDVITFTNFLRSSKLDAILNNAKFMVFVPTDDAFNRVPEVLMKQMFSQHHHNPQLLHSILAYHIVPYSGSLRTHWTGETVPTLGQSKVRMVTYDHNQLTVVNGLQIRESNLTVSNGHIYFIDDLLSAPTKTVYDSLRSEARFSTFLTAVTLAGMKQKIQEENVTVFVPTNEAFDSLSKDTMDVLFNTHSKLQAFVDFHIIRGFYFSLGMYSKEQIHVDDKDYPYLLTIGMRGHHDFAVYPGGAVEVQKDWLASNGVIHVINHTVLPHYFKQYMLIG